MNQDGLEIKIKADGQWVFNETYHVLDAVRASLGIAYIPEDLVATDIAKGHLVQVLNDYSIEYPGFHLYYPHRRQQTPALKLVIESLRVSGAARA